MPATRIRPARLSLVAALVACGAVAAFAAHAATTAPSAPPARAVAPSPEASCAGAVVHPIVARVEALDPVRRGATVRLRVVASSAVGLSRAEARLVHSGAARAVGATHAALGALHARSTREAIFRIVVPPAGQRALVEFKIDGEGPNGRLARGVAYNLLPDGPTQIGRPAIAGDGTRVIEYGAQTVEP
jgi:hypothetical protein